MARGMTRAQLGITDAMLATFGETVFRMSHNLQAREGDPVRRLDWPEIERQREAMGLSDGQIAARLGLTSAQVMFIRNSEESRRFRTGQTVRVQGELADRETRELSPAYRVRDIYPVGN